MQKPVPYSKAFAARPPREVVIGIAKDVQGKYNPITLGMFTHVSDKPPVLAVSIALGQCRLIAETVVGNHAVVFGEVVAAHLADPPVRRLYILGPGYRMGPLPG